MDTSVSVIIPVFNEERTLATIIEIVRTWGKASEIIVVNDGSTDDTAKVVAQFESSVRLVSYKQNKGKGYALYKGIMLSTGRLLMFLDGDITGLTHRDLDLLLTPLSDGTADMVLGIARFWTTGWKEKKIEPFNTLTGVRIVKKEHIIGNVHKLKGIGYGVELFLNKLFQSKRTVSVRLPYVFVLGKWDKLSISKATKSYLKEASELMKQIIRQHTDELTPPVKSVLTSVVRYLRQTMEYFS